MWRWKYRNDAIIGKNEWNIDIFSKLRICERSGDGVKSENTRYDAYEVTQSACSDASWCCNAVTYFNIEPLSGLVFDFEDWEMFHSLVIRPYSCFSTGPFSGEYPVFSSNSEMSLVNQSISRRKLIEIFWPLNCHSILLWITARSVTLWLVRTSMICAVSH